MTMLKSTGQRLAVIAQLALMATISIGLATNTQDRSTNTLLSPKTGGFSLAPLPSVSVWDPTPADRFFDALSPRDAKLYRAVFAAQEDGDWDKAKALIEKIEHQGLMGSVHADRFSRLGASGEEYARWLDEFPALPEADAVRSAALKQNGGDSLAALRSRDQTKIRVGKNAESAASFASDYGLGYYAMDAQTRGLAKSLQKALARKAPEQALQILENAEKKEPLPIAFTGGARATLAAAFFRMGALDKALSVASEPAKLGHPLGLWIKGLVAWKNGDFNTASAEFGRLAVQDGLAEGNKAAANFWAYRSLEKVGKFLKAQERLEAAADCSQSFYGILAQQLLGENPLTSGLVKQISPPAWSKDHQEILAAFPAGWRALAFVQIGQIERAEAELRLINAQSDERRHKAMVALAAEVPMPALVRHLTHLKTEKGYDPALYSLPPWQPMEGFKVDRALLFALAHHESLFDPQAISVRGARGLMQLMPATADAVIAKHGLTKEGDGHTALFDPSFNMSLGQLYVRQLTDFSSIGDNLVLLLTAYNAGPGNAAEWRASRKDFDPLLFIESLPSRETRRYITRVLPHYWAYRARLGRSLDSLSQLAQGLWPKVVLAETTSLRVAQASR